MCAVYAYPGGWFKKDDDTNGNNHNGENGNGHNGNGRNGNGHNGNGHRRPTEALSDRMQHALTETNRRELQQFFLDGTTVGLAQGQAVKQLEELLVRPMPRWKRVLDLVLGTMALLVFSPLMLMIAMAIKLTSRGPAVFCQPRAGLGGKPFTIYKFRTMCLDAEAKKHELRELSEQDGPAFKLTDDPRITLIGRILRKTSLDELPQLWNVVKGDMSLVGPRPLPVEESDNCDQWHRQRLEVTPGLTCIWQVTGRSMVSFDEWVRMDITYIRRRKLFHDLSLLAQTLPAVLLRKGAR
jgi:lipopolysaccharide/colanic/teichoic acid biosynthesis glycosyltransferase